ncbi:hypothetical protein [Nostoc sp. NMS7]|uniref:hypothetical protein n=1 Tax=Nostoc sp. NMS7 TaxID=2815391 RepID=UPI0025DB64A5|nr:hypothetical protein [Nostoc sp. NMS7]
MSAGVGTSALASTSGVVIARQINVDPMVGVLAGSVSAIAVCAIAVAWFFSKNTKNA